MVKDKNSHKSLADFIIIGAAKSGTTTLFTYLHNHPEVFIAEVKEVEYFCNDINYLKGNDWYKTHFSSKTEGQICGEASTTYSRWPHTEDVPKRMVQLLPDVKLIYIMRHPVERTYSHYLQHLRKGEMISFEDALLRDTIYTDCSKYMLQINRYLEYYPRENFLFLLLDELKNKPHKTLERIQNFLGVNCIDLINDEEIIANKSSADYYIKSKTTDQLLKYSGGRLLKSILPATVKEKAFQFIKQTGIVSTANSEYKSSVMLDETRKKLLEIFKEDTSMLEQFLNVNLETWKK